MGGGNAVGTLAAEARPASWQAPSPRLPAGACPPDGATMSQPDPWTCPDCHAPLPERYRVLPEVTCPNCGQQKCFTGNCVLPVAGPVPPVVIRTSGTYWLPAPPQVETRAASPPLPATTQHPEPQGRRILTR